MKNSVLILISILFAVASIAQSEPESVPDVCLPNMAVIGSKADVAITLVSAVANPGAVRPVAVQVIMGSNRCVAITATYLDSDISYAQVRGAVIKKLGHLPDSERINASCWTVSVVGSTQVTASVSYQSERIKMFFVEHPAMAAKSTQHSTEQTPVPVPLTEAQDAELVRQGVLPPQTPDGSVRSSVAYLSSAIDIYEIDVGMYPKTLDSLFDNDGKPGWAGPYAKSRALLKDDKGNVVQYDHQGSQYILRFPGPDGIYGTADDIISH